MSAHAKLSPSGAKRWLNCPGSLQLSESVPEQGGSIYAEEGTRAHALAEVMLGRHMSQAEVTPAEMLEMSDSNHDMLEAIQGYTSYVKSLLDDPRQTFWAFEKRVSMAAYGVPECWGTADVVVAVGDTLHIIDLKYGRGVFVDVEGNEQALTYAAAALGTCADLLRGVRKFRLTIVQPRMGDGLPRHWDLSLDDVLGHIASVRVAAALIYDEATAPRCAGDWCRWCPAQPICPEKQAEVEALLAGDFAAFTVVEAETTPADFTAAWATTEQLLERYEALESWATDVRAALSAKYVRGEALTRFKLVPKRASRKWRMNEDAAIAALVELGLDRNAVVSVSLLGLTALETLARRNQLRLPADWFVSVSSGETLVGIDDPRPAASRTATADEFTVGT